MNNPVELQLSQPGTDLMKKYPGQIEVLKHPSGMTFYTLRWRSEPYGKLVIGRPPHTVTLPFALSAKAYEDSYFPDEKIVNWNINAGLTEGDEIGHEVARERFFGILKSLRNAGWQRVILRSDPRLDGKDNMQYVLEDSSVSYLDPDYLPEIKEWMMLGNRSTWGLYLDHAYLTVTLTRDPSRTDINKPGAYFLEYALRTDNQEMRSYVDPDQRKTWKAVLPGVLAKAKEEREKLEEEWQRKGARIDRQYQDPPVPELTP